MKIITFGFWKKPKLLKMINEWIYNPCAEDESIKSITVNLPDDTIERIDKETNNRSWFVRERIYEALEDFPKIFKKPHFPSRSEFIRSAVDYYYILRFSLFGPDSSDEDNWLETNGIHIIGEA